MMPSNSQYLIDTHAHLDLLGTNEVIGKVLSEAKEEGVGQIITVGFDLDSSRRAAGLTEQFTRVFSAAGIHPHHADNVDENMMDQIRAVTNQPKVVAIGETGLDYYRMSSSKDNQLRAFKAHIELSKHIDRPLIIHCRDAYPEMIKVISESDLSKEHFVIHCYSGTVEEAKNLLELGAYLSFAGNITFENADDLREVVKIVPLNRLLLETDCPYLTPHPHRGKKNQPSLLHITAKLVADEKGIEVSKLIETTSKNAQRLFVLN